jgi:hypothetical protein
MLIPFIPVPPLLTYGSLACPFPGGKTGSHEAGLAAPSLSEGSVNLDEALQRSPVPARHPKTFGNA